MSDKLCMVTDSENERTAWSYKGKIMISNAKNYELMTSIHEMIRDNFDDNNDDLVEGIKFMINTEGL